MAKFTSRQTPHPGCKKKSRLYPLLQAQYPHCHRWAKDNKHSVRAGMPQALEYARILDIPCVFSSNCDGFVFHDRTAGEGALETELSLDHFPSPAAPWEIYKQYKGISSAEAERIVTQDYYLDAPSGASVPT